jgi:hypothetical protein
VIGIQSVTFATNDVERYTDVMSAVTGVAGQAVQDAGLKASGIRLAVGGHEIEYLAAGDGDGPLTTHRPAPYRVRFRTTGEARRWGPAETAGVRMELG